MADDKHERIRQRAFEIWEQAGRPEGEHEQHWHQAAREIEAEDALTGGNQTRDEASIAERPPTDLTPG